MKKLFIWSFAFYLMYLLGMSGYLFFVDHPLPEEFIGTVADPTFFMNDEQLLLSKEFSQWRNFIYFIYTPLEWLIYLFVLSYGLSQLMARWSEQVTRWRFLQSSLYIILLSCFASIIAFPIKYVSYMISKQYGISIQTFHSWMKEQMIGFWIEAILLSVVCYVIVLLLQKSPKKWWFYTWLLSIPFTLFLLFIQPVVIDPLYNDFYPIQNKQLEEKILTLAEKANIPADRVYEVKMSDKTNALNAYVTGIGSNLRIVLWDTTLERLTEEEVLFVMAHEMGHYDLEHLKKMVITTILLSFIGLYITSKLYDYTINKFGQTLSLKKSDIGSLPIILLILALLGFAVTPFSNIVSRAYEYESDRYAIDLTENREAAVTTFQKLAVESLSEVYPPTLVKWLRYTHPPMVERIIYISQYKKE